MATIYRGTRREIERLGRALRAGQLVGVPTETVYGLAADALNARACRRIFAVKGRPASDPLIVHVSGEEEAGAVAVAGPAARRLMRAFWPGPLTIVLPKRAIVPEIVTAGRDSVAVRAPAHPLMRKLLAAAGRPLAAPSANPFGYVSPTSAEHVQAGLGRRIRHILDGGACAIGVESTILDLRDEKRPRILRPGKIGRAQLERVLGRRVAAASGPGAGGGRETGSGRKTGEGKLRGMLAPGMLERHYSPRTRVIVESRIRRREAAARGDEAWVFVQTPPQLKGRPHVCGWSDEPGLAAVARGLFSMLRRLDSGGWKAIHVERVAVPRGGDRGLAEAINDRLRRAAAR